ncbi:unnamed protein product, partial [Mesorhabditis spiculigera]
MVIMIAGTSWVRRGIAKQQPDNIKLDPQTLKKMLEDDAEVPESTDMGEDSDDDTQESAKEPKAAENPQGIRGSAPVEVPDDGDQDMDTERLLEDYDKPEEEKRDSGMKGVAVFASNMDDPYITTHEDPEEEEEKEDFELKPDDNLVAVAKIDGDAYSLEVYVYNETNDDWYVHHDYILTAPPLCLETLNYDPGNDDSPTSKGNLMAVGTMESSISIWDLDIVNAMDPVVTLEIGRKKRDGTAQGHSDAVLDLSWNRLTPHVLASAGADKTVVLWDLDQAKAAQIVPDFDREVQAVRWHPAEPTIFAAGTLGGHVYVCDCRSVEVARPAEWQLGAQIEKAIWDHFNPFAIVAATEDGKIRYLDTRNTSTPVWSVDAHQGACNGIALSPLTRGLLASVGEDRQLIVWKMGDGQPTMVNKEDSSLGPLHSISFCPDSASVVSVGGELNDLLRIVDLRHFEAVVEAFQ